jgi:hypothetical protein
MSKNNEIFYKNLVILFKLFKNSPNHLSKYLINNNAFSEEFINSIINSKKLNELRPKEEQDYFNSNNIDEPLIFKSFEDMEEYYSNILKEIDIKDDNKDVEIQLNKKLNNLIDCEKYEEAARLRDYMSFNNFEIY